MKLVFVYGTLKKGGGNYRLLENATFVAKGHTQEKMQMLSAGGFPVVFPDVPRGYVTGEIYAVDDKTLASLDRLESAGSMYLHHDTAIVAVDGVFDAMMYVGSRKWWHNADNRLERLPADDSGYITWQNRGYGDA